MTKPNQYPQVTHLCVFGKRSFPFMLAQISHGMRGFPWDSQELDRASIKGLQTMNEPTSSAVICYQYTIKWKLVGF